MTERISDDDVAYRLIHPNLWLREQNRPMSSLFRGAKDASVFMKSRLLSGADDELHVGSFQRFGRVALPVGHLRELGNSAEGEAVELDVVLDPDGALPPFEHLRAAHAVLVGTDFARGARLVLEYLLAHPNCIERVPD